MHKKGQKIHSSFHRYFLRRKRSRTLFARFPRIFGVLSTPNTRLQAHLHYTLTTTVCSKVFVDVFFVTGQPLNWKNRLLEYKHLHFHLKCTVGPVYQFSAVCFTRQVFLFFTRRHLGMQSFQKPLLRPFERVYVANSAPTNNVRMH